MQDRTINAALAHLWRHREPGWELAGQLLELRGVEPPRPAQAGPRFRRRELRMLVLEALRDGPMRRCDLVAYVAERRPDMAPAVVYRRVGYAMDYMQAQGVLAKSGRVWRLAP